MNPEDKIKKLIEESKISTDSNTEKKILGDSLEQLDKLKKHNSPSPGSDIWKIIMKSQLTKIAAAAAIIIAFIAGLTLLNTTSGVALANVLTQIEKIKSYSYQKHTTLKDQETGSNLDEEEFKEYMLFSREYGFKRILDTNNIYQGNTRRQEYFLLRDKAMIIIYDDQKKYSRSEIDDGSIERMRNESYDPAKIIEMVLICPYSSLGFSTIDGKRVEGFETTDPDYAGGVYDKIDIKLWVDVKTQLPVEMEISAEIEGQGAISGIINNYQWNIPVNASEFEPVIPDDFTFVPGGTYKLPANTEDAAIEGLKHYANLFGSYPKELNPAILTLQIVEMSDSNTPAGKQFMEELKKLSPKERNQKYTDIMQIINEAAFFYTSLVQNHKDAAYYGDIISPGDENNVLMRWKISDNDYRIIFGDLKAETVTYETLIELEQNLPKYVHQPASDQA